MANIKSSKKDIITSELARQRNVACRTAVKTAKRKVLDALAINDLEAARKFFRDAESLIARAGKKGVFKKEAASRKVSRLSQKIVDASKPAAGK
jgi:small subunit ribosomal protein S20